MQKTIIIDGRAVEFRSTAALPRLYRIKYRRDIFTDIQSVKKAWETERERQKAENDAHSHLDPRILSIFEDIAYIMAKHAGGAAVPDSVEKWLDEFETFSIDTVIPEIFGLWLDNCAQTSVPAKK
ncbi:MAG: hypothetical protein IJD20_00870 [Oscillospiraceae bacterium]|nr:hypothetical protein [Oscillospiraceae bacterium]